MESSVATFGDVFTLFDEVSYVFLAAAPDSSIVYAAKILTTQESRKLERMQDNMSGNPDALANSPVFCFVVLETENYEQQIAHLRDPRVKQINRPHDRLSQADIDKLKREISEGAVPGQLKELIANLG